MKTYKTQIMKTDVPNANGMVYPSEVMDKVIKKYNEEKVKKKSSYWCVRLWDV